MKSFLGKFFVLIAVSGLVLGGLAGQAKADLVTNGNFDANTPPSQTAPLGWTFTPAPVGRDFFVGPGPTFGAFSPPNSANFGATSFADDTLSQTLATSVGATYTLSYELAHDSTNAANDFSASWGGVVIPGSVLVNAAEFNYTPFSFTLTATSTSTVLSFSGRENPAWYELDNVSVVPGIATAPEPTSLTLLSLGALSLAGYGWRGRRKAAR